MLLASSREKTDHRRDSSENSLAVLVEIAKDKSKGLATSRTISKRSKALLAVTIPFNSRVFLSRKINVFSRIMTITYYENCGLFAASFASISAAMRSYTSASSSPQRQIEPIISCGSIWVLQPVQIPKFSSTGLGFGASGIMIILRYLKCLL